MSILCCPCLKKLTLYDNSKRLQIIKEPGQEDGIAGSSQDDFELKEVVIDRVCYLKSLSMYSLISLIIDKDEEVECLSQLRNAFQSCASSLQILHLKS